MLFTDVSGTKLMAVIIAEMNGREFDINDTKRATADSST
jgi:hypothetical protein